MPSSRWPLRIPTVTWQRALVGLAASVIVLAAAVSLLRTHRPADGPAASDPFLARVLDKNMQLAAESSPAKRLQTLEKLADDLDGETRSLALLARTEDLTALAEMYEKVIRNGLLQQAGNMRADEKATMLPDMADRFFTASHRADDLTKEVPPAVAVPLKRIAAAARDASNKLRQAAAAVAVERNIQFAHDALVAGGQS